MNKKICIVTDRHISVNPRVWKEAKMLSENGYDVSIVTQFNSRYHKQSDDELLKNLGIKIKYHAAVSLIKGDESTLSFLYYRIRVKIFSIIKKIGFDSIYLATHAPERIFKTACDENADLYIAHEECGMYVGKRLLQKGKKVAFDIEDWHSKDYLNSLRPVQLLIELESYVLRHGLYISCPSVEMAKALVKTYPKSKMPVAIYNGFPIEEDVLPPVIPDKKITSLVWFSQTIGPGRGLEKIFDALHRVATPIKISLIGNCSDSYKQHIQTLYPFNNGHDLEFIPFVKHNELHALLLNYDIGLALEDIYPANKDVTVSNKILQYLQAGIKVLATNTAGQKEVAAYFAGVVEIVDANDNTKWSDSLQDLIVRTVNRKLIIEQYNNLFSWEAQESKLLPLIKNALDE